MADALLSARDLHTYYGDSYVLQGPSLDVREGTIVAILGRNGMGKTTLIRSVAGLTPPRRGEVRFRGESLRGRPPYAIAQRGIALVPQGRRIFRSLSVRENLLLPTSGLARPRAGRWSLEAVLKEFPQLAERMEHGGGALSGGEQQMLAIARALMSRPRLLLLDEPSLGLAPMLAKQIFRAIRELNERDRLTVFLVEQNAYHALKLAHRGYVIVNGEITLSGSGRELLERSEVRAAYLEGGRRQ